MHLLLIIAVLAALAIAEHSSGEPVPDPGLRVMLSVAAMLPAPLLAGYIARTTVGRLRHGRLPSAVARRLRVWRAIHVLVWLGTAALVLHGLGWVRLIRFNWGLSALPLADDVLVLAPVLVPLVLSWAAWYPVEREFLAATGQSGGTLALPGRWQYVGVHVRHYLGILLIPVLVLLGAADVTALLFPHVARQALPAAIYIPVIVAVAVVFPHVLRHTWSTRPLEGGPLRHRLETLAHKAGFHAREILVWNTGGLVLNAAVAGILPCLRYVFLSDGLLARLREEQIEAVFGHEVGHLRYRHLLWRLVAIVAPLSLGWSLSQLLPEHGTAWLEGMRLGNLGTQATMATLAMVGLLGYMLLVFGPYCRMLEGQADLFGCRLLGHVQAELPDRACSHNSPGASLPVAPPQLPVGGREAPSPPDQHRPAVERYSAALEGLVAGGVDRDRAGWQHASIARRIDFLRQVANDPQFEQRYHRRLRWVNTLLALAAFSPLAAWLW